MEVVTQTNALHSNLNVRTDIYGQMPMTMLKIRVENPNDMLYILRKSTGIFEVNIIVLLLSLCDAFFNER